MKQLGLLCLLALGACTSDSVDSNEQARRAYLGLDPSVEESILLGFDGFNAASSANIDPQMAPGTAAGMLTITGQVDQGSSANKGMRLHVGMVNYSDGKITVDSHGDTIQVTYDTSTDPTMQPSLTMMLKNIPTGTLSGTLTGVYQLSGDLKGDVTLDLTIAGQLADGGNGTVVRAPGTTTITGTATQGNGTYDVDVTL